MHNIQIPLFDRKVQKREITIKLQGKSLIVMGKIANVIGENPRIL